MRIAPFLLIVTAASLLAWTTPPTVIIIGKVLTTEKVRDFGPDNAAHFELWKAEVKVESASWFRPLAEDTNIADTVAVYYTQDWSTNYVAGTELHVGQRARPRLGTNQVYGFMCNRCLDDKDKTNAFRAYDGGIIPK